MVLIYHQWCNIVFCKENKSDILNILMYDKSFVKLNIFLQLIAQIMWYILMLKNSYSKQFNY